MRSRTIRFASAESAARRTLIPFASRAAAVRFTRASLLKVPNRRLIDGSSVGSSSLIICSPVQPAGILASTNTSTVANLLHMQVESKPNVAGPLAELIENELPGGRGLAAWQALL